MQLYFNSDSFQWVDTQLQSKAYSQIIILVDQNTEKHCLPLFKKNLQSNTTPFQIIKLQAGENQKTLESCALLWSKMLNLNADRNSLLICLGGGVLTDMGGFVAAVYKRGIDVIYFPTTLLAMVDASIGGKNGVNFEGLKNMIGVIKSPKAVCVVPAFLETLSSREIKSGFAEIIKHGLICDSGYWNQIKIKSTLDLQAIIPLIKKSIHIKQDVVSEDMNEKGLRQILNFGHTLGHAIESYCLKNDKIQTLTHGEAIAIGMIMESYISYRVLGLKQEELDEIVETISIHFQKTSFKPSDVEEILKLIHFDKKNKNGETAFVLIPTIGKSVTNQRVAKEILYNSFTFYQNLEYESQRN